MPTAGPQPPPQLNQRPRQPYPQQVHGHMQPRQSNAAPREPVPKPKKKVLAIVDPLTKEEIKVSTATPSSSPPTIPKTSNVAVERPTSRPLSLVEPVESSSNSNTKTGKSDDSKPADNSIGDSQEGKRQKEDSVSRHTETKPSQVVDTAQPAVSNVAQIVDEPEGASAAVPADSLSNKEYTATADASDMASKTDDNLDGMTSDVSSSTFADARTDSTDLPQPSGRPEADTSNVVQPSHPGDGNRASAVAAESASVPKTAQQSSVPNGADASADPASVSYGGKLPRNLSVEPSGDAPNAEQLASDGVDQDSAADVSATSEKDGAASDTSASKDDDTSTDASPESSEPVFLPGQRRVYPPKFMVSMRPFPNASRLGEFQSYLSSSSNQTNSIMKDDSVQRNDSGRIRPMRTGSGSLSSDPRGSRAFNAPPSGFTIPPSARPVPPVLGGDFDLRSARLSAPPAPRTSMNRGDPRVNRTAGPMTSRFDGPTRHGQSAVDPFIQAFPVAKLKRSENGWKRNKEADNEVTAKVKQVRSLLNKLTIEKFDKIFDQIVAIDISSTEVLTGVVEEIFEKTLFEPKFSDMYAELCRKLDEMVQPILDKKDDGSGKEMNFRRILLNNCKEAFTRFANSSAKSASNASKADEKEAKSGDGEAKPEDAVEKKKSALEERKEKEKVALEASKAKARMLANVRFIGELYLKGLLKETIIHKQCIQKLLTLAATNKEGDVFEEDVLEAVCKLLSKTGAKLSRNPGALDYLTRYFRALTGIALDPKIPARIRFMIQDLVEQRDNQWKVRREEAGAKKISEIHQEVAAEEKAKSDAQNATRERKSRGGGGHMHGRGGSNYQPRVSLTMASAPNKAPPPVSRTNSILEKQLNRHPSTGSIPNQSMSMRLGPGGSRSSGLGGSGGMGLRPNGAPRHASSGSRFSALNSGDSGGMMSAGSGDARRSKLGKSAGPARRPAPRSEAPVPKIELMDETKLKRKTQAILSEYWDTANFEEVVACLKEEILEPNYPGFVLEAVKATLEAPANKCEYTVKVAVGLLGKVLPAKMFLDTFEKIAGELSDYAMDFPLSTELFARLVGGVSVSSTFQHIEGSGSNGIGFLKRLFEQIEEKHIGAKMIVIVCATRFEISKGTMGELERKRMAIDLYESIDVDLAADMTAWDSMMGPKMLYSCLDRANMSFLISTFECEKRLRELLESGRETSDGVLKVLNEFGTGGQGAEGVKLLKMIIRVALDWALSEDASKVAKVETQFNEVVGSAVVEYFGSEIGRQDLQMGALLATQCYFAKHESKLAESVGSDRTAPAVFKMIFSSGVVGKECLLFWKEDMDCSVKVAGKEKMLLETSGFFTWLNQN